MRWYEDGGRKLGLGVWAAVAVIALVVMDLHGVMEEVPFVALMAGAIGYFIVRGAAFVAAEIGRRPDDDDDPESGERGPDAI